MDELEQKQRKAVVDEAVSWIGTPYHWYGRKKGVGVDCGMFLLEVFERAGVTEHIEVPDFSQSWHLHHSEEKYLAWVKKYCREVIERKPLPGDILLYQYGRCISHGAIVIDYPTIVHSFINYHGVVYGDTEQDILKKRLRGCFSYWRG